MAENTSLFARKLRAWRAAHGIHGRMTQERLAEMLGVSVDAVGKYERSVSFVRGDLEHRLADRLGWSRDEIVACREDWEARQRHQRQSLYRLLDKEIVDEVFNGSWRDAIRAMIAMAEAELGHLPDELAANEAVFLPIYDTFRSHWAAVMCGDRMVAKWSLTFLLPEDETLFKSGRLIESELSVDRIRRPILPGTYYGYCPALVVCADHEAAGRPLFSSFVRFLEALAERDVLLHGIGAITCSAAGVQICRELGMSHIGIHSTGPSFEVWDLPGAAIPESIFARRSPILRQRYSETLC